MQMKSNTIPHIHALVAALFTLSQSAFPQSKDDNSPRVALKIDVVSWGEDIPGLTIKSSGKSTEVKALAFRYSKAVAYSGSNILEISQTPGATNPEPILSDADKEMLKNRPKPAAPAPVVINPADVPKEIQQRRKDNPTLVALALIPVDCRRATILLAPGKAGTFQAYVIDDDPSKLPPGKLRIHNYSALPIAMRCNGKEARELNTKDSMIVPPEGDQVIYELAYKKEDAWKIQENNVIPVAATDQAQLIVLQSDASFFASSDGSRSGFLQCVVLRRLPEPLTPATP